MTSKQLNFLIGSGVSSQAIALMKDYAGDIDSVNTKLLESVISVSQKLLSKDLEGESNIEKNYFEYISFIQSLIDVLNLSNSRIIPKSVNLFTTNYDLFIESAIDTLIKNNRFVFNDGAKGYFNRILDSSNYNQIVSYKGLNDNYISEIPSISLFKPHGSVNWELIDEEILIKNEISSNPVVVKPDGNEPKNTFLSNHFYEMLRIFQLELDKPQSILIVIGFSFHDEHIAKMVKRALKNPELIVVVFGYQDRERVNILRNLNYEVAPNNLKIITPKNLNKEFQTSHEGKASTFELPNLTKILSINELEGTD
ncbi:hypothetical protein EF384_01680 [Aerococcus agrisoli]|uniref:Uncharacterized protein n=1 Tax=Aerococcus agrisoli TaxID=2487350 RepID=A0A3N4GYL8_9LACT|nr:hypothetical protein EF384_01680 [Aerococcus agrisoli]